MQGNGNVKTAANAAVENVNPLKKRKGKLQFA